MTVLWKPSAVVLFIIFIPLMEVCAALFIALKERKRKKRKPSAEFFTFICNSGLNHLFTFCDTSLNSPEYCHKRFSECVSTQDK